MNELVGTIDWVAASDLSIVAGAVRAGASSPLVAVGSGGSLSAATHLSRLHRSTFGKTSAALTPYSLCAAPVALEAHHWIFSAGGSNADVVAAVEACVLGEVPTTNIVTMASRSKVARLTSHNPNVGLHVVQPPSKKDGFLATNSLLAFCALMSRAYLSVLQRDDQWNQAAAMLGARVASGDATQLRWRAEARKVERADNLVVLYDAGTLLGAFDLESKLTEAGVKNVQLADYRHFAHGRHHWLAKNASTTGVLAFLSSDRRLAERTLGLMPNSIPVAKIEVDGNDEATQLCSLLAAFFITEELSFARGIDPGQPGVPDFGRKVYGLRPPATGRATPAEVAIRRKLSSPLASRGVPAGWLDAHAAALARVQEPAYGGLVLDYDGTVVDTPERFSPPSVPITSELVRLLNDGLQLGIATGRGRSAGDDLRAVIPDRLWPQILVGYYNGGETKSLHDQDAPDRSSCPSALLLELKSEIELHGAGLEGLTVEVRNHQLTVSRSEALEEGDLWLWVTELIERFGASELRVLRSSHSVDVIAPGVSKLAVVREISDLTGAPVLRIGDRGRWPGNDHELLASPYGLSVDQVSHDPQECWNLVPQGLRGTQATLFLLESLTMVDGALRLDLGTP